MSLAVVGQCFFGFSNPIAINRILKYVTFAASLTINCAELNYACTFVNRHMETQGEGAVIQPWFWIAWFFLGPTFSGILFQWYIFLATRVLAHTQSLITQLVFEHSLRIRFVAEERGDDENDPQRKEQDPTNNSESGSVDGSGNDDGTDAEEASTTASSSQTAVSNDTASSTTATLSNSKKGKGKETHSSILPEKKPKKDAVKKDSNLIGKINNLVTTDLGNIGDARDFLYLS